ncbi:mammalian cell entry protein, partial [Rhodococcus sp. CSLK01-03]|nr:mammalian cell entry protein [Rhodococcus indonesiensis]
MSTRIRHSRPARRCAVAATVVAAALTLTGCEWEGLNSLPLPGTAGHGEDAYQ